MDEYIAMKGKPSSVLTISQPDATWSLCNFTDGTWTIFRDGRPQGFWESDEKAACVRRFAAEVALARTLWARRVADRQPTPRNLGEAWRTGRDNCYCVWFGRSRIDFGQN